MCIASRTASHDVGNGATTSLVKETSGQAAGAKLLRLLLLMMSNCQQSPVLMQQPGVKRCQQVMS